MKTLFTNIPRAKLEPALIVSHDLLFVFSVLCVIVTAVGKWSGSHLETVKLQTVMLIVRMFAAGFQRPIKYNYMSTTWF